MPRNGLRFSRFEHTSPSMLWEWEALQPEIWLLRTGRVLVEGHDMLLCVVDADCEAAVAMCEELLPPTSWTVDTQHGRQYYYLTTEISSQRIIGGLDHKCGRNVYVIAPSTPEYVQSADWGHGWPPTLTMRQWIVLEQTWLDQRPEPESHTGSGCSTGRDKKRRQRHNQAGGGNWRSKVQQCEIHPICEGRRHTTPRRLSSTHPRGPGGLGFSASNDDRWVRGYNSPSWRSTSRMQYYATSNMRRVK